MRNDLLYEPITMTWIDPVTGLPVDPNDVAEQSQSEYGAYMMGQFEDEYEAYLDYVPEGDLPLPDPEIGPSWFLEYSAPVESAALQSESSNWFDTWVQQNAGSGYEVSQSDVAAYVGAADKTILDLPVTVPESAGFGDKLASLLGSAASSGISSVKSPATASQKAPATSSSAVGSGATLSTNGMLMLLALGVGAAVLLSGRR
jgi:hypothetical protein